MGWLSSRPPEWLRESAAWLVIVMMLLVILGWIPVIMYLWGVDVR